jgi:hypothetical protein
MKVLDARESGHPERFEKSTKGWIPACAGMTMKFGSRYSIRAVTKGQVWRPQT